MGEIGSDPWIIAGFLVVLIAGIMIGRFWPRRDDSLSRLERSSRENRQARIEETAGTARPEVVELRVGSHTETHQLSEAAIRDIQAGKLINAIKRVRDETGLGLREAKDAVEDYARKNGL